MANNGQDPFVKLVETLVQFSPEQRELAVRLAALYPGAFPVPEAPSAAAVRPKPKKAAHAKPASPAPKRRGRKPGSKNKPKVVAGDHIKADPVKQSFHQVAESV